MKKKKKKKEVFFGMVWGGGRTVFFFFFFYRRGINKYKNGTLQGCPNPYTSIGVLNRTKKGKVSCVHLTYLDHPEPAKHTAYNN